MVKRQALQGTKFGESFWGCSGFPVCRGTRQLNIQAGARRFTRYAE
jgi:restriction system protein